ncbi:MAG: hypothetical protein V3U71_08240 [Cocleimonas sp.]
MNVKYLLLCLALLASSTHALEIKDFKSGLICAINKKDMGWVCIEKEDIEITGQSSCIANGKEEKCTWYGYSYHYEAEQAGEQIDCKYHYSTAVNPVNPVSQKAATEEDTFTYKLPKKSGYYINAQYSLLGVTKEGKHETVSKVECFHKDKLLFKYRFKTILPTIFPPSNI